MTIILTMAILPLTVTAIAIYYAMEQGFTKLITNQQEEMEHTVQTQFNKVSEQLLDITKIYANNPELIGAFRSGERQELYNK